MPDCSGDSQVLSFTFLQTKDTCMAMKSLYTQIIAAGGKSVGIGHCSGVRSSLKRHRMHEVGRDVWNTSGPRPKCSYTKLSSFTFSKSAQNFGVYWDWGKGEEWFHSSSDTLLQRDVL